MSFNWNDHWIPLEPKKPVWIDPFVGGKPSGVTWHWTGGFSLARARGSLTGGRGPYVSAHYCVGRSFADGIDRYIRLEHRSGHCGKGQTVRVDGGPLKNSNEKASRTTIGIETVARGNSRAGVRAQPDWLDVVIDNHTRRKVEPWTDEQYVMMVAVGAEIQNRWSHLTYRNHHGHIDLAPGRKIDPCGLDFARLLRAIYADPSIPDIWRAFNGIRPRYYALLRLGYLTEEKWQNPELPTRPLVDALKTYQTSRGLAANGRWNTMTAWAIHDDLAGLGIQLDGPEFRMLAPDPILMPRHSRASRRRAQGGQRG